MAIAQRPHEHTTVRGVPTVAVDVSDSQVIDIRAASPRRRRSASLNDATTQAFFADGERQEALGVFTETPEIRVHSLDRVPRRWWRLTVLGFAACLVMAAAGAWWLGFRPSIEWQRINIWQLP